MRNSLFLFWVFICSATTVLSQDVKIGSVYFFEDSRIHNIETDSKNQKWIVTSNGTYVFNDYDKVPKQESSKEAYAFFVEKNGDRWLGLENNELINVTKNWHYRFSKESIEIINNLLVVSNRIIIATTRKVLIFERKYGEQGFDYTKEEGIQFDEKNGGFKTVNWIFESDNGNILIGADNGLYSINQNNKIEQIGPAKQFSAYTFYKGSLWLAGEDGIWELTQKEEWIEHPIYYLKDNHRVRAMHFDRDGKLWLLNNKLVVCDGQDCKAFSAEDGFTSKRGLCLDVDQNNTVWVGTEGKGVFKVSQKTQRRKRISQEVELCSLISPLPMLSVAVNGPAFEYILPEKVSYDIDINDKRKPTPKVPQSKNLIILVDVSLSMNKLNKFENLTEVIKENIGNLNKEDRVSIITFSQYPSLLLSPLSAEKVKNIDVTLKSINIDGVSNIDRGIISAIEFMETIYDSKKTNQILVITDGLFELEKETLREIKNKRKYVSFSVLDLGKVLNKELKKIAQKGRGYYTIYNQGKQEIYTYGEEEEF